MSTSTQPQVPARLDSLLEEVRRRESDIAPYLAAGVDPQHFWALARRAIRDVPEIASCSTNSVLRALAQAAASGLPLDGNFSSLVVRRPKQGPPTAHWSPSYRGCIWQALASGHVKAIEAHAVREADQFDVELGTEPKLHHKPCLTGARGPVTCAYGVAELASGGRIVEVLTREDLERIRAMSPLGERGPWNEAAWFDEMARKSCIRRLLKRLPAGSTRAQIALRLRATGDTPRLSAQTGRLEPEHAHAVECKWLAALSDAASISELDGVWQGARLEYQQLGVTLPLSIEAKAHDLREALCDDS